MKSLLELLFPPKCPFCAKLLRGEAEGLCVSCQLSLPYAERGGRSSGSFFSLCVSPLNYTGSAREALLRYKFSGKQAYAKCFAALMADCIRRELEGKFDLITWVPLDLRRLRGRGYSQSRMLAEETAKRLSVPCQRLLSKRRHTVAQSTLKGEARRRANVSAAFSARRPELFADKRVLLIDDVVTTGATLSECARILLTAGADRVYCATLCRAQHRYK